MIKKALLSTLFIGYIICPAQAQNTDTVSQKRETFVLEEGTPRQIEKQIEPKQARRRSQ